MNRMMPVVTCLATLVGCGDEPGTEAPESPAPRADVTIRMVDYEYQPAEVTIRAGQVVKWVNAAGVIHTVTADADQAEDPSHFALPEGAEPFDSGQIRPDGAFRKAFEVPGTYRYFCVPHQNVGMVGTIEVRATSPAGGEESEG